MNIDKVSRYISDYLTCALSLTIFNFLFELGLDWVNFLIYSVCLFGVIEVLKRV